MNKLKTLYEETLEQMGDLYKSPIEAFQSQMEIQMEGEVLKAVQRYGIKVDKEELLKALQYDRNQYDRGYEDGFDDGYYANKWTPCSERLPERGNCYLITDVYGGVYEAKLDNYGDWVEPVEEWRTFNAIAWMPLPKPYEQKGE